jgi:hypothetical protein
VVGSLGFPILSRLWFLGFPVLGMASLVVVISNLGKGCRAFAGNLYYF